MSTLNIGITLNFDNRLMSHSSIKSDTAKYNNCLTKMKICHVRCGERLPLKRRCCEITMRYYNIGMWRTVSGAASRYFFHVPWREIRQWTLRVYQAVSVFRDT